MPPRFKRELIIPSSAEGLNECLDLVAYIKIKFGLSFETSFCLNTVIVESVENAIVHGNKGKRDLSVRVCIVVTENEILLEVEDKGDGFNINSVPSPIEKDHIASEGGRGIFIMKKLSLSCNTIGKGNTIRIKLKK